MSYTLDTLKNIDNYSYNRDHGVTASDVDKVNTLIALLDKDIKTEFIPGVFIVCKGGDKVYKNGHLEDCRWMGEERYHVCVKPMIPHVSDYNGAWFSTSGGYWFSIPEKDVSKFKYIGTREKMFWTWGHNGACAGGGLYFRMVVGVWEITDEGHIY